LIVAAAAAAAAADFCVAVPVYLSINGCTSFSKNLSW